VDYRESAESRFFFRGLVTAGTSVGRYLPWHKFSTHLRNISLSGLNTRNIVGHPKKHNEVDRTEWRKEREDPPHRRLTRQRALSLSAIGRRRAPAGAITRTASSHILGATMPVTHLPHSSMPVRTQAAPQRKGTNKCRLNSAKNQQVVRPTVSPILGRGPICDSSSATLPQYSALRPSSSLPLHLHLGSHDTGYHYTHIDICISFTWS